MGAGDLKRNTDAINDNTQPPVGTSANLTTGMAGTGGKLPQSSAHGMTSGLDDLARLKIKSDVYNVASPVADCAVRNLLGVNAASISRITTARPHVDGAKEWASLRHLISFTCAKGLRLPGRRDPIEAGVFIDRGRGRHPERTLLVSAKRQHSRPMRAFLKAVSIGALAGAALPLFATVPLALVNVAQPMSGRRDVLGSLWFAALPFTISFAIVLTCATVIGLPVHLALRKSDVASQEAYVFAGGAFGVAVTLTFVLLIKSDSYWLALLGGFSGATTGWSWWKEISDVS